MSVKHPPKNAFTLVELLVVVAIIAVLAALSLPAISSYSNRSKSTQCMNNLKQIGVAALAYAADNDGQLPPLYRLSYGSIPWSSTTDTNWWPFILAQYLGITSAASITNKGSVFRCPSVRDSEVSIASGWNSPNGYGYGALRGPMDYTSGPPMRLGTIEFPSKTWLIGDCGSPINSSNPALGYNSPQSSMQLYAGGTWNGSGRPACRHRMGTNYQANLVACDGHVEFVTWGVYNTNIDSSFFGYVTNNSFGTASRYY